MANNKANTLKMYIYIDGADGTGKSTLVKMLKENGYTNVYDRSILTQMSLLPIRELPKKILDNKIIVGQIKKIKSSYPQNELKTNRDLMTKLNLDCSDSINDSDKSNENSVVYIILDADVETCLDRLAKREKETGIKLNSWDSEKSVRYFRSKYIFLAYKYQIPIVSTENKSYDQVFNEVNFLIKGTHLSYPKYAYIKNINNDFNPDILELEWINLGCSDILYADDKQIVCLKSGDFDMVSYQNKILQIISKQLLANFINILRRTD
jgi:thymidylate kinase